MQALIQFLKRKLMRYFLIQLRQVHHKKSRCCYHLTLGGRHSYFYNIHFQDEETEFYRRNLLKITQLVR